MKFIVLLAIAIFSALKQANSQNDSAEVVISHVFFCVDSATYANLFKHEFITKLFANTSESSTKTTNESWTGKYISGRQSYIEVFAPANNDSPQLGDKFGDAGIVFRTKKPGEIHKIDFLLG